MLTFWRVLRIRRVREIGRDDLGGCFGGRLANAALWRIVTVRLRSRHTPTIDYLERRVTAGNSKRDAIRYLKRDLARELYNDIEATIATTQPRTQIAA